MTREVIVVGPEVPVREIARVLWENGVSGVPVVAPDGTLVGVVSERD
jgi:CBS domain-containing protein